MGSLPENDPAEASFWPQKVLSEFLGTSQTLLDSPLTGMPAVLGVLLEHSVKHISLAQTTWPC